MTKSVLLVYLSLQGLNWDWMGSRFLKSKGIGEDCFIQSEAGRATRRSVRFKGEKHKAKISGGNWELSAEDTNWN